MNESLSKAAFLLLPFLCLAVFLPFSKASEYGYSLPYQQAVEAMECDKLDSAFQYFSLAFNRGMSKDSLLYYWAEIYRKKLVLDTALALNFSIKGKDEQLKKKVYSQRYLIYISLGWKRKAEMLIDSLRMLCSYRRSLLVPDITAGVSAGYLNRKETVTGVYPWNRYTLTDTADIEHGVFANLKGEFEWRIYMPHSLQLRLKLGAHAAKPYYVQDGVVDSFKIDGDAFCSIRMKGIAERFSLELRPGIRRNHDGTVSNVDNAQLSYGYNSDRWFRYACAMYFIEIEPEMNVERQNVSLIAHLDRHLHRKAGFGFTLYSGGHFGESLIYPLPEAANVFYVDDVEADFVTHYLDSNYTDMLDTAEKTVYEYFRQAQDSSASLLPISALYSRSIECTIPRSYITINPSARLLFILFNNLQVSVGGGWRFDYYMRPNKWVTIPREELERYTDENARLAYNRADGNYYMLREQITADNAINFNSTDMVHIKEVYENSSEVFSEPRVFKRRRIDNAAIADLSLELETRRSGEFYLGGEIVRLWTTLDEDCPFEVPKFSWSVNLGWSKTFIPVERLTG